MIAICRGSEIFQKKYVPCRVNVTLRPDLLVAITEHNIAN